jgi:hypothetical protein
MDKAVKPFLRGMGAKEDFIAEQFVPDDRYKAKQMQMVQMLVASGMDPKEAAGMFAVPLDPLPPKEEAGPN